MIDASSSNYPNLNITGPISVTPVVHSGFRRGSLIVILGPTGSGKSTFIEALSPQGSLRISSNQLEGFTRTIGTYKLVNVTEMGAGSTHAIYLVDVPGFADTKISETSIVSMLREWIKVSPSEDLGRILYLTPILSPRLPGSHRQVLRTVQAMTGSTTASNITIVTTMWDRLWSDTAKMRAESNFNELRDIIWKEFMDEGGQIVKFYNNQDSALSILNTVLLAFTPNNFHLETSSHLPLKNTPFSDDLRDNLRIRIQNLDIERGNLQDDLKSASAQSDETLRMTLASQFEGVERLLRKFTKDLHDNFGPNVDDGVQSSSSQVNIDHPVPSPGQELLSPHQDVAPSSSTTNSLAIATGAVSESPREISQGPSDGSRSSKGIVIKVIRALKCWGEDTRRRYND